jgi:hypothetical protein
MNSNKEHLLKNEHLMRDLNKQIEE